MKCKLKIDLGNPKKLNDLWYCVYTRTMYKPLTNARLYVDPQIERLLVEIWRKKSFEKAFASWSTNLWHKLKKNG